MKLVQVSVEIYIYNQNKYRLGSLLFDCGLLVGGIHFAFQNGRIFVNLPAVKDKKQVFHPSFILHNSYEDRAAKELLRCAYEKTVEIGDRSIYGQVKDDHENDLSNLKPDDIEWSEAPWQDTHTFTGSQQFPVDISVINRFSNYAYVRVLFGSEFTISNIKVSRDVNGSVFVQYPIMGQKAGTTPFVLLDDAKYVYERLKSNVSLDAQGKGSIIDENRLRQILWNASNNGYILQARIAEILKNVDWRTSFRVSNVTELVEKMDFLSVRLLESSPGNYVKWVSILFEKETDTAGITNPRSELSDELKNMLRTALAAECQAAGGKLDLSTVRPILENRYAALVAQLPNKKLKAILSDCDFIAFEGGPIPPIYIRIVEENCVQIERIAPENELLHHSAEEAIKHLTETKPEPGVKAPQKEHTAENNPFKLYPQTKLVLESMLPDSKLEPVNSVNAMKYYDILSVRGQFSAIDLEILYWISNLQYSKGTFLMDIINANLIDVPPDLNFTYVKLEKRLTRLFKAGFIYIYRLCSEIDGVISKSVFRIYLTTPYASTQLRGIGRRCDNPKFLSVDNTENILGKLSVNQWFTKFVRYFPNFRKFCFSTVVSTELAFAIAARIKLIVDCDKIPAFVTSIRRGLLHNISVRSGDFSFWITRVTNVIKSYKTLYLDEQPVSYRKQPLLVFVCEDNEHCYQVYNEISEISSAIGDDTILDSLCFTTDVEVFNRFLDAHFRIDKDGANVPFNIADFFETEIKTFSFELEEEIKELDKEDREENDENAIF